MVPRNTSELSPEHIESIRRPATGIVDAFREHAEGLIALNREDGTRAGNMVDAKAHFQNAIGLDPDYADPHYRLATLLQHEKDVAGAEKSYREALRADVDHRDARYRLGLLLIDEDRKSEAMSELDQALKQSPEDPRMQTALSSIWFDQYQSNFQQMADQIIERGVGGEGAHASLIGLPCTTIRQSLIAPTRFRCDGELRQQSSRARDDLRAQLDPDSPGTCHNRRFSDLGIRLSLLSARGSLISPAPPPAPAPRSRAS